MLVETKQGQFQISAISVSQTLSSFYMQEFTFEVDGTGHKTERYFYQDTGEAYVSRLYIHRKHGLTAKADRRFLKDLPSFEIRARNKHKMYLYNQELVEERMKWFFSLPKVEAGSDFILAYVKMPNPELSFDPEYANNYEGHYGLDEEDHQWMQISSLERRFRVSNRTIKTKLRDASFIEGRDVSGRIATFYNLAESQRILQPFADLKNQTDKTGEETQRFQHIHMLCKELDMTDNTLLPYLNGVAARKGIAENGQKTTFYDVIEARKRTSVVLARPRVEQQTGSWLDSEGEEWVPVAYFRRKYPSLNGSRSMKYLTQVDSIKGRSVKNGLVILYNKNKAVETLEKRGYKENPTGKQNKNAAVKENSANLTSLQLESLRLQFLSLPQEQAWVVADSYWEYVKANPDNRMAIPEYYVKVYLAAQGETKHV